MSLFVLLRPAGRRGTVGVTEEATEERPFHLLKALCDCWYLLVVRFRSLPPSPSSLRSSSHLPAHHVLKCVSPPDAALPNHPSSVSYRTLVRPTGDCPHLEVKNPSASSYLYLERGFINRSKLPFRAYYPPFVKPVSRSSPRRCRRRRPSPSPVRSVVAVVMPSASGNPLLTRDAHQTSHSPPRFSKHAIFLHPKPPVLRFNADNQVCRRW